MTKALKKKVGRPKKAVVKEVVQENPDTTIKISPEDQNWEVVEVDARKLYASMNKPFKRQISLEQFLSRGDNLTGFGANSKFTPLEDR